MRRSPHGLCALVLFAAALMPLRATGEVIRFRIDASQSYLQIESGSQISVPLGIGFGTVVMALEAPTNGSGHVLPGGVTSDGLRTSLGGHVLADVADTWDAIRVIRRRTSIELGNSGSWLPGVPANPGAAAFGELAIAYADAGIAAGGSAVLRETTLSLGSDADVALTPGPPTSYTFPAGCSVGDCPVFRLEDAMLDSDTSLGPLPREGLRETEPLASPPGTTGALLELPDGRYQLTVPIALTQTLSAERIGSGVPLSIDLVASGQIVAVPEPTRRAGWIAALLGLLLVARRRALAMLAAVALLGAGCVMLPHPDVGETFFSGITTCFDQNLLATKDNGAEVIGDFDDPNCALFGFMGNVAGVDFTLYPYVTYSPSDADTFRNILVGVSVDPVMNFSTAFELRHSASFTTSYLPRSSGSLDPQLWVKAKAFGLGSALGEPAGGSLALQLGTPRTVPVDGQTYFYDLDPQGGSIGFDAVAMTERIAGMLGYQGLAISYGIRSQVCNAHQQCLALGGMNPYCTPWGCTDGSGGAPCEHDSQCQRAAGYFCNSMGQCAKGEVGDACDPDEGDCADANECGISLICQVKF